MPCFASQNYARTSIWPIWSMNFNNSTLWEALVSWVIEGSDYISLSKLWVQYDNVSVFMLMEMFTIYLHASASHQSISLCLCSSHGINTNSPLSSKLREAEQEKKERRVGEIRGVGVRFRDKHGQEQMLEQRPVCSQESRNRLHHTQLSWYLTNLQRHLHVIN